MMRYTLDYSLADIFSISRAAPGDFLITSFIADDLALLIDGERKIIGISFFNFKKVWIDKMPKIKQAWEKYDFDKVFTKWQSVDVEEDYNPVSAFVKLFELVE